MRREARTWGWGAAVMLLGAAGCATGSTVSPDGGELALGPDGAITVVRDAGQGVIIVGSADTGGTIGTGNGGGTGAGTGPGGSCPAGQVSCNGVCTDTTSDPSNCGACAQTCGGAACVNSLCACRPAARPAR